MQKIRLELEKHLAQFHESRPIMIGIDGLGGAGKTTITKQIADELKRQQYEVLVIHLDDHIMAHSKRYDTGNEQWYEYYYLQWDVDRIIEELFEPIHQHASTITLTYYEQTSDTHVQQMKTVSRNCIVLIEGVFLQRIEWQAYFDLTFFVDCPFEVRRERVLTRDRYIGHEQKILRKYEKRYWPAERYYCQQINPHERADMLISSL